MDGGRSVGPGQHLYHADYFPSAVLTHQFLLTAGQRQDGAETAVENDVDAVRFLPLPEKFTLKERMMGKTQKKSFRKVWHCAEVHTPLVN